MRCARQLVQEDSPGLYHVVSRVVDRRLVFGEPEKARFRTLLQAYAEFSGIDVVAWCLMGNHFHLLLRVPPKRGIHAREVPESEVVRRVGVILGPAASKQLANLLLSCGSEEGRREVLAPIRRRMGDLGLMMKTLKQRFTQWFNGQNGRKGTLWEERYRSYIIPHEDDGSARGAGIPAGFGEIARIVAAYIDNNPVRAGLVDDPGAYPWSGFGEAVSGKACALAMVSRLWGLPGDEAILWQRRMMRERGAKDLDAESLVRTVPTDVEAPEGACRPQLELDSSDFD